MTNEEKILFLEKLLAQTSKKLSEFNCAKNFFLFNDFDSWFEIGTNYYTVNKVNEKTHEIFVLNFVIHGNDSFEKSSKVKHNIKTMINRWKKHKNANDEDALLQIVHQMENEVSNGWSIGMKIGSISVPGIIMWHAHMPIEQLSIELDIAS